MISTHTFYIQLNPFITNRLGQPKAFVISVAIDIQVYMFGPMRDNVFLRRDNVFLMRDNVFLMRDNVFLMRDNVFLMRDNVFLMRDNVFLMRDNDFLCGKRER